MKSVGIGRKISLAFVAIVMTIAAMSVAILWNLSRLETAADLDQKANKVMDLVVSAEFRMARQENSFRGFVISGDSSYIDRLSSHREAFLAHLSEIRAANIESPNERQMDALVSRVQDQSELWNREVVETGKTLMANPGTRDAAAELVGNTGRGDALMGDIENTLAEMLELERAEVNRALLARESAEGFTRTVVYCGLALALASALILAMLLSRMIATPVSGLTQVMGRLASGDNAVEVPAVDRGDEIGEMAKAVMVFKDAAIQKQRLESETSEARAAAEAERARNEAEKARKAEEDHVAIAELAAGLSALSDGDLTYRITAAFSPEAQRLKDDFNRTASQLQETMATISSAIDGMRNGTGEISQAADDLSRRTEQQAASLEQTAAALDEITATVKTTAEGAHKAQEVTSQARVGAEKSGAVVRDAVSAMAQIEKSSQQIGQIIGVIDEIAFQTNLLALNAGVEAARAGEAGKGFAVVASEVRALAQRSAEAAKEIKDLISTSTQQVDQGVDLVGQTGTALEKIVAQVAEITGLVTEIAASAREQSTGLGEVNSAVNQMDQVTQQNAAMVEQSTAASHNLAQEAEELARLVGKFRLGAQAGQPAARKVAVAANSSSPAPAAPARPQQPTARPALKRVATGRGQAAVLIASHPADDGWEEF